MEIYGLPAEDARSWVHSAAESIANTRMVSGALSRGGAADLMRSIVSKFRYGIPENMGVWIDGVGSWLWGEYTDDSHIKICSGYLDAASDIDEWARFVCEEFAGLKVSWCVWGETDSLTGLVETLGAAPSSVILGAPVSAVTTPVGSSGAWLRPMGAGELMRFQVAAANELGLALVTSGEQEDVDKARREAFRSIEAELSDGVASPGHRLYSLCHGGQTVGGAWLEIDSGVAVVRSVVVVSENRGQGHRRAALAALAAAAHMEGARQIQTTVMPPSHPFATILQGMGMGIVSTDYIHKPAPAQVLALQSA